MSDEPKSQDEPEVEGHRVPPCDPVEDLDRAGRAGRAGLNEDESPDVEGHINRMGPEGVREAEGVRRAG